MNRRQALPVLLALGPLWAEQPARKSPEFVIKGPAGQSLLSQYKGKVVLLEFLFTT